MQFLTGRDIYSLLFSVHPLAPSPLAFLYATKLQLHIHQSTLCQSHVGLLRVIVESGTGH